MHADLHGRRQRRRNRHGDFIQPAGQVEEHVQPVRPNLTRCIDPLVVGRVVRTLLAAPDGHKPRPKDPPRARTR